MKHFYVEVDTNDADYIGKIVEVEDASAEKFKPLIEKIKNFKPYVEFSELGSKFTHNCNFPHGECLREDLSEKHPCELYDIDEETYEEFVETFELYGGEWGFHTIEKNSRSNFRRNMVLKYKVGDRVRIKSIDWYNENKDAENVVRCGNKIFDNYMSVFCGSVVTIGGVYPHNGYDIREDMHCRTWTDEMIEGRIEETQPKFKVGDRVITNKGYIGKFEGWVSDYQVRVLFEESGCNVVIHPKDLKLMEEEMKSEDELLDEYEKLTDRAFKGGYEKCKSDIELNGFQLPDGYQFVDENGNVINATKIILEKKKKEYPKTYEECSLINGDEGRISLSIIGKFTQLINARNAYWKIAGDEMGLEKPWEYDCKSDYFACAIIYRNGWIQKVGIQHKNAILAFPTAEMRDAFYENFKELIESCKELL